MREVKLIALDVDGTLTDGQIHYDSLGAEHKHFHTADGLGIVMAQSVGLRVAVVSGRQSAAVERRMAELKVGDLIQGAADKGAAMRGLLEKHGLKPEEAAFVGDDLNDLPAFDAVGVRIAVCDGCLTLISRADYVTVRAGGHGAVREAIEEILRRQGRYEEAVAAYLAAIGRRPPEARQ